MWEAGGSTASSSGAGGGGGGDGRRKPSYRERENNRRRERRRRAFATKIYSGLRSQGNFNLPKNCDNNEVLKALCSQAGWIVESDGTTYRKGCSKPSPMEMGGIPWSNNITPSSSRNPSPPSSSYFPSYQPSPLSSSCTSPTHHRDSNPFAFLFSSSSLPPLRISNSAPVTPPLSSPSRSFPMQTFTLDTISNIPFFASAPSSPTRVPQRFTLEATIPECDHESDTSTIHSAQWSMNFQAYANAAHVNMVPTSPTFNLVKPMTQCVLSNDAVMLDKGKGKDQFDFENMAVVKPWEGERIHEEVGLMDDDLQLTLGSGSGINTRV